MSFPDPTPPPHQYISPPYPGGDAAGVWPSYWMGNDQQLQQQQQPDSMPQFDHSKKPPNFSPFSSSNPRTNPPGNKGTSHIFYKTRICAKFMEGTCRNGEHCTFAHGAEDLREPPPNWQELIREKERGAGSGGNWGDDQRIIHRMKICKKYYNGDECPYGDKCNFLHDRPSPPLKKLKADMPGQRECSAISIGTTGDGRGGSVEFEQAAFWKTRLCSKWEMGQCPFGERCHFAHGQSELRLSGAPDEAEVAANGGSALRKATSISAFTAPANLVVAASANGDEDEKMKSKWKLTRRINRIYGDWLDDSSPPRCSPSGEEM